MEESTSNVESSTATPLAGQAKQPRPCDSRPLRLLWRALRSRDADGGAAGARGRLRRGAKDKAFRDEYHRLLADFAGRPTPLFFAKRLTEELGGAKIYLKREDLLHTGAHKINNCLGQALLARRMGKHRIIAETGAGQHGVATATVCALLRHGVRRLHGRRGHARARN